MSLWIIFFFALKKTVAFGFTLYLWGSQSLFFGQSSNLENEVLVEWALNQIKYWLAAPTVLGCHCPGTHNLTAGSIVDLRFWSRIGIYVFFREAAEYLSTPKTLAQRGEGSSLASQYSMRCGFVVFSNRPPAVLLEKASYSWYQKNCLEDKWWPDGTPSLLLLKDRSRINFIYFEDVPLQ